LAPQQSPASWRGTSAPTGSARLNRAFRLDRDETIPDGIRRVARGQLDQAHAELSQSPKRELATAVHDARKGLKRLRATVRLARGAMGEEIYRRENAAFRDNGRRLSGVRDASVLIETLDELEEVSGEDLPRAATARLRERLEQERKQALESLRADDSIVAAVAADIEKARTRTAAWTFELQASRRSSPACAASTAAAARRCAAPRLTPRTRAFTSGASA
jgi:CHAD domain-containing protein